MLDNILFFHYPDCIMRISRRKGRRFVEPAPVIKFVSNEAIKAPEVRVIDENNEHVGIMPTAEALAKAREGGWDMIEINPTAIPPVVQFGDYGQFRYQKEKEMRKQKARQKTVEVKGIRLSLRIGAHDLDMRKNQALKFFEEGDRVRVEIILRGRERMHSDRASALISDFIKTLGPVTSDPITKQAGVISTVVTKTT